MWKCLLFSFICFAVCSAQQTEIVDFKQLDAKLEIIPTKKKVQGTLKYRFLILQKTDSIYLDGKDMQVIESLKSPVKVSVHAASDKIWLRYPFKENTEYEVVFNYVALPEQTMYFFEDQVWTQGQGKYTSHWLPSLDDVNDKIVFNISITVPSEFLVIANGNLTAKSLENATTKWQYKMQEPMSSYLVAVVMGKFQKQTEIATSGIPLEYYYLPEDKNKVEPTYRYTKKMFDFFEKEIGVPYPWQNYKQVPVRDFLYAGMENTTLTVFSNAFMVDSIGFTDRNYVNVNAHELAHQWFGNLVTATSGEHHWLQEGFATYYALMAEREIFGDDYFYWKLYESAGQLQQMEEEGNPKALLDPGAGSLTFYQKGAWALHILRETIGEDAFRKAVRNYLNKHAYKNVSTNDFLAEAELSSGKNLSSFREIWLEQVTFPRSEVLNSLEKSPFIKHFMVMRYLHEKPLSQIKDVLAPYLAPHNNEYYGQEVVSHLSGEPLKETHDLYLKAFHSEKLLVRQAIALTMTAIPEELREEYETLLDDNSYLTIEVALYKLWLQFPEKRNGYLNKTMGITGFADKNIRQLWLTLALMTESYRPAQKQEYLNELRSYTSPQYSFEIRRQAFQFLTSIGQLDDTNLKDLVDAGMHPNWQFAKSSRELLDELLKEENIMIRLTALQPTLSEKKSVWLKNKLNNILPEVPVRN